MSNLYLIRHGETDWNVAKKVMGRTDIPLNSRGETQAKSLAEIMKNLKIDAIYTSPQLRAKQTAEAIAQDANLTINVEPALAEVDFPKWIGLTWDDLHLDPDYKRFHEGLGIGNEEKYETRHEIRTRTGRFVDLLIQQNPRKNFALVSHADPIRAILNHVLAMPMEEFRRFRVAHAGLTVLVKDNDRWLMTLLNYRKELNLNPET